MCVNVRKCMRVHSCVSGECAKCARSVGEVCSKCARGAKCAKCAIGSTRV